MNHFLSIAGPQYTHDLPVSEHGHGNYMVTLEMIKFPMDFPHVYVSLLAGKLHAVPEIPSS